MILSDNSIFDLINEKSIIFKKHFSKDQLQPASLDLTLGNKCYRVKASFLSTTNNIYKTIKDISLYELDLNKPCILEKNAIYLCELNESLNLPNDIFARTNPKSTTGRLDIFTRTIFEKNKFYEETHKGYKGKIFLEIIPQSFNIQLQKNAKLAQIRFFKNRSQNRFITISAFIKKGKLSAYKAKNIPDKIDLNKKNFYNIDKFWERITPTSNSLFIIKLK